MSIPFNQLQDKQIVTEKNFDEIVEEIRRMLEETTEEFEDVPF
jgi:DNA-binding winged helix-turn-helix (wHTH) protein